MSAAKIAATRAGIYVRLSDENVAGKRLGIESTAVQRRDAREAIAREGWTVEDRHVYVDDGLSGRRADRDALLAALAAAKRGEFDVLVVRDQDRFSRQHVVDALVAIKDLAAHGVRLWSYAQRQFISVDGDHVVLTAMRARQAAVEAEKASERIGAGLLARAREGRVTGLAPFGYRIRIITEQDAVDAAAEGKPGLKPGKWYVQHEDELKIVRHVVRVFLVTESFSETSRRLNAGGVRAPSGGGWAHIMSAKKILYQPLYRGYRMFKGLRIEHPDLAILDAAEVRRLESALKRASKNRPWASKARKPGRPHNLAVPFVACGVCGGAIVASGVGTKRMYVCDAQRLQACRGVGYRSAARVDEAIVRIVGATLTDDAIRVVCGLVRNEIEARPKDAEGARARAAREIAACEKRVANLTEAVAEAPAAVRSALYAKLASEQDRLATLRAGLARLAAAPAELDGRRLVAKVQKRAADLRALLAKGGAEAAPAVRAVLGATRLKAHLVSIDGRRGWKLSGRIEGAYVLDDAQHGSDPSQKAKVKGVVAPLAAAPAATATQTSPANVTK